MGITEEEQEAVMQTVSSILHLSNITFTDNRNDESSIDRGDSMLDLSLHSISITHTTRRKDFCRTPWMF